MPMPSILTSAFRRKTLEESSLSTSSLSAPVRTLTLLDVTLLGIGGTLGSGLFILTGHVAREISGPSVYISYAIAALVCLFSVLPYAEMSSRYPTRGGAYSFTYATVGQLPAFLVGMCLTLEYGGSAAAIARAWASYLGDSLPGMPDWMTGSGNSFCVLGFAFILVVAAILLVGLPIAKWLINCTTLLYCVVVVIIVMFGAQHVDADNWKPLTPFGMQGVIAGASVVFFSYVGFDEVAILAEETVNPSRNTPIAMLLAMFAVSAMYIAASIVLTGMQKYSVIETHAPFSAAMRSVGLPLVARIVGFGTVLGMSNTGFVAFAAQPRLFMAMGSDHLLPASFASSLHRTTIGCGLAVAVMALLVQTDVLAGAVSGGTLLAFLATDAAVLLTRARLHVRGGRTVQLVGVFTACSCVTAGCARLAASDGMGGRLPAWVAWFVCAPVTAAVGLLCLRRPFGGGECFETRPPAFLCPGVPGLPLVGMFATIFLLGQLPSSTLLAVCGLLAGATLFYFVFVARNAFVRSQYVDITNSLERGGACGR